MLGRKMGSIFCEMNRGRKDTGSTEVPRVGEGGTNQRVDITAEPGESKKMKKRGSVGRDVPLGQMGNGSEESHHHP